jgi:hypothetical protein
VAHCELMHVCLADDDCACILEPFGDKGIMVRNAIIEDLAGRGSACACCVDVVLQSDRQTMERTTELSCFGFGIEGFGLLHRIGSHDRDERIELRVVDLDAFEEGLSQFDRRYLMRPDLLRSLRERQLSQGIWVFSPSDGACALQANKRTKRHAYAQKLSSIDFKHAIYSLPCG